MESEETDGIHGNGIVKYRRASGHIDAGGLPLHAGVRKDGQHPFLTDGTVKALGTVSGGIDMFQRSLHPFIHQDPAADFSAGGFYERRVGPDAYGQHQNIEGHVRPALHMGQIPFKTADAVV